MNAIPPASVAVGAAWNRLRDARGAVSVSRLTDEIGCSRGPGASSARSSASLRRTLARILRFDRAVELMTAGTSASLADVALRCGYYDQSHLVRDTHAFAGSSPTELMARRLPQGAGIRDG